MILLQVCEGLVQSFQQWTWDPKGFLFFCVLFEIWFALDISHNSLDDIEHI